MLKYLLLVVIVIAATHSLLYAQKNQPEGNEPYTPTKLEWLSLRSTAAFGSGDTMFASFKPHPEQSNTIRVDVFHNSDASESRVKAFAASARRTVTSISKEYQWDWVNVDVNSSELITSLTPLSK